MTNDKSDSLSARGLDWFHSRHAAICDEIEPWAHGTVVRATKYPGYFEFNVVRVEEDPRMSLMELVEVADEALAGLTHRRLDFELISVGEELRVGFEELGWRAERLLLMRHQTPPPTGGEVAVEEVPYDAVHDLRVAWFAEDFPDQDPGEYHKQSSEVAARLNVRVLAVTRGGVPVAFSQLQRSNGAAEVTEVFVDPDERGSGLGTALTKAAITAAGPVDDLWICADDEDRAKELYTRLGFQPVLRTMEFTRWPEAAGSNS